MIRLSIAIPCYGRHELLDACLRSIDTSKRDLVQVVLVDDGSEPPLHEVASKFLQPQDEFHRQQNRGRGAALREALLRCAGNYVLVMDSDDEFIPGAIDTILQDIEGCAEHVGFVYECLEYATSQPIAVLPDLIRANLLELRADMGVVGDLKEVILREAVLAALYPDPGNERRVPTSYIWANVATKGPVALRHIPVVRHRYLAGGMTQTLSALKRQNPRWLAKTYLRIAAAPAGTYQSKSYRYKRAFMALAILGPDASPDERDSLRRALGVIPYLLACMLASGYGAVRRIQAGVRGGRHA